MQYYDQRKKTLKRIAKVVFIILVTIVCIAGIYYLINLYKSEEKMIALSKQQEQQRTLALRPLYEEKNNLEKQLADIANKRNHATDRSTVIIPLLTDCSETLVHEFSAILQPHDYPAVICISDTYYPGAEGCISIAEAKGLAKQRWEFMIDISSNVDRLTELLQSSGLTKPVAIYSPNKDIDSENISFDLPLVYYGDQSNKTLFDAVYGMQSEEIYYAIDTALFKRTSIIMTAGTILSHEKFHKSLLIDIISLSGATEYDIDIQILSYNENEALQTQYYEQQQKVFDETEAEFQSISYALGNIKEQINQLETNLLK